MSELPSSSSRSKLLEKITMPVKGMTCAACSARVEKGVGKLEGVADVAVNLATDSMQVQFDSTAIDIGDIAHAVADMGYEPVLPASSAKTDTALRFAVSGMHCAACSARIEKSHSANGRIFVGGG